jgi:hypothetical protein
MNSRSVNKKRPTGKLRLVEAVRTPLNLFVLIVVIADAGLLAGIPLAQPDLKDIMLYAAIGLIVLVLMVVAALAAWRPGNLFYSEQSLAHSLGVDIFEAVDMYVSNLESEKEQVEAFKSVVGLIRDARDPQHRRVRRAIADVIQHRVEIWR